jgi:hypothetical protein
MAGLLGIVPNGVGVGVLGLPVRFGILLGRISLLLRQMLVVSCRIRICPASGALRRCWKATVRPLNGIALLRSGRRLWSRIFVRVERLLERLPENEGVQSCLLRRPPLYRVEV